MVDEKLLCCFCLESCYGWNQCFSQLESLNDKKFCDSVPIPIDIDIVGDIISKTDVVWSDYDEGAYEPESEL